MDSEDDDAHFTLDELLGHVRSCLDPAQRLK